ncbi:ATP-binding cassette domain-containing protein [bacterium]|nr:ATP-binding cassette domain-containing protein [bacterium]
MDKKDSIIEVKNLTVRFGDNLVLDDISFNVYRGEILVILGGSGSGKSTLMKHMIGLIPPESGEVIYDGVDIISADDRTRVNIMRKLGVLFQSGALLGSMTLGENVGLPISESTKISHETIEEIVALKLAQVDLAGKQHLMPAELSGGMKKRGGLARAMALDPIILFFDEPSAGLDPITSTELDDLIIGLNDQLGTTMIVVTHELQSIYKIAQRCIMIDRDTHKIIGEGKPEEMRDQSANPKVRAFFNRERWEEPNEKQAQEGQE